MVNTKGQINNDILRRFPSANINILNGGRKNRKSIRKNRKSKRNRKTKRNIKRKENFK